MDETRTARGTPGQTPEAADKPKRLETLLAPLRKVVLAFSGGVDSTFLLAVCREILGNRQVLALTAETPFLAAAEIDEMSEVSVKGAISRPV